MGKFENTLRDSLVFMLSSSQNVYTITRSIVKLSGVHATTEREAFPLAVWVASILRYNCIT